MPDITKANIKGINRNAITNNSINFGNIDKVEINFLEMDRQSDVILKKGTNVGKKLNELITKISALASLVGSNVSVDKFNFAETFIEKARNISEFMKKQIDNYKEVNNLTEYEIFQLNELMKQLRDEDGELVSYIDKDGNLVTVAYQEILADRNRDNYNAYTNTDLFYPNFDNEEAWTNNSNFSSTFSTGQCTWFARGRFYEIYGYDPEFWGNGRDCAYQLINAHGDLFNNSYPPVAGSIFSVSYTGAKDSNGNECGHVGIILSVDGDQVTFQHGNWDGDYYTVNGSQIQYNTETLSMSEFEAKFGGANNLVFANPKNSPFEVILDNDSSESKTISKTISYKKIDQMKY